MHIRILNNFRLSRKRMMITSPKMVKGVKRERNAKAKVRKNNGVERKKSERRMKVRTRMISLWRMMYRTLTIPVLGVAAERKKKRKNRNLHLGLRLQPLPQALLIKRPAMMKVSF